MGGFTTQLQAAELWPIRAKKAVTNWHPLGDPRVEKNYHAALEDGRELQKSITDANNWLMEEKKHALDHIQQLFNHVKIGTDGKLDNPVRAIKYGYDIINFMQQVSTFQGNVIKLIQALTQNIGILQSMEANILAMVQENLNAVASLLHDICNWGLPDLPAIPNLFSDNIWNWNGFNFFPLASFIPHPNFDTNFSFGQCNVHLPNVDVLRNFPSTVNSYNGLTYGAPPIVPPLGGIIPNTGVNLSTGPFFQKMQTTTDTPYYTVDPSYAHPFNPFTSMQGSLPDPQTVISKYQMPPATYAANILSAVPSLLPDVLNQVPATLRKDLIRYVTLGQVVSSNFDPNLTAAWIFYVSGARNNTGGTGRQGQWLQNFEAAFQAYVQPSVSYLGSNPVPWNAVLPGTTLSAGPTGLPFISTLTSLDPETQGNALWRLSYVEAAILGYTRDTTWDGFADNNYVGTFTGKDLDYASLAIVKSETTTIILGEGTAAYPVTCTFPSALTNNLVQVIAMATPRILLDTTYQSPQPQYRFTYDQFAIATVVDRFSQFWREFNGNLQALLVQDPYLVGIVCAYPASLDSAIDPLGDPTIFNTVQADVASRNRTWVPGFPLLPFPTIPVVVFTTNTTTTPAASGWTGTSFDPVAFLSRPDIQVQPIPVQAAMLQCNMAAASLMAYGTAIKGEFDDAITLARQQAQAATNFGFQVESANVITSVPPGNTGALVEFDQIDFDQTNYVTTTDTFTIQASGAYAVTGQLVWSGPGSPPIGGGEAGVRTVTVYLTPISGSPPYPVAILTASTPNQAGPVTLPFGETVNLTQGDILTVVATHSLPDDQFVVAGSLFSAVMYQSAPDVTPPIPPSPTSGGTANFIASVSMPALTAVYVDPSGGVSPIDPTTVNLNPSGLIPPFAYDVYPYVDGITLSAVAAGGVVTVAIGYGSVFQVPGAGWTPGGLLYAGVLGTSPITDIGFVTQNFEGIILQHCQWVIVVGRALDSETFSYEPHIPTRVILSWPMSPPS